MKKIRVLGADLSLTSTGVAEWRVTELAPVQALTYHTQPKQGDVVTRARLIRDHLLRLPDRQDLVVVEGMSWGSVHATQVLTAVGWVFRAGLADRGLPHFDVAPATLKKFVTGRGDASKEQMIAVVRNRWRAVRNDDEADAVGLAAFGVVASQIVACHELDGPFLALQLHVVCEYLDKHGHVVELLERIVGAPERPSPARSARVV